MKQACYGKRLLACYDTLMLGAQSKASKVKTYFPELMICEVVKELMTEKEKTRYGWGCFLYRRRGGYVFIMAKRLAGFLN